LSEQNIIFYAYSIDGNIIRIGKKGVNTTIGVKSLWRRQVFGVMIGVDVLYRMLRGVESVMLRAFECLKTYLCVFSSIQLR